MSTPYELTIDGHRIAALGFNEHLPGPAVFFLHGITSSLNFWVASQTEVFQSEFRWYTISLPGHYPARFPHNFQTDDLTSDGIGRVLKSAIDRLAPDAPLILIGHSTGGFSALNIAARWPERIAGVVSISGFARGRWSGALAILQWLARQGLPGELLFRLQLRLVTLNRLTYRASLRAYAKDWDSLYAHPGMEPTLDLIYPAALNLDLGAMLAYFRRMPDIDISALLPHITAPTLVMAGDADPIVPPEQARFIAEQVPGATLAMLSGCGHLPMSERASEYEQMITDFVRQRVSKVQPAVAV